MRIAAVAVFAALTLAFGAAQAAAAAAGQPKDTHKLTSIAKAVDASAGTVSLQVGDATKVYHLAQGAKLTKGGGMQVISLKDVAAGDHLSVTYSGDELASLHVNVLAGAVSGGSAAAKPAAASRAAAASAPAGTMSEDALRAALKAHPDVLLDVLKENRKQLFDIVETAAQEEQARRQKEAEEQAQKEFEDAFKNPKKPAITSKTNIRGNKDAKFTLVEYSDFQCPYCGRGFQTVETLRKKYGGNLRFIYKDMPLPFHPQAMPAAKWFEAVALQSPEKAWLFHDKMFENQDKLSVDFFKQTVKDLGLNVQKAEKDANSKTVADKIQADSDEGHAMGFDGTPGFLLNGIPVKGAYPVDYFDNIIARLEGKAPANDNADKE